MAALKRRNPRIEVLANDSLVVHPRPGELVRVVEVDYAMAADGQHILPRGKQDTAMRRFVERAFVQGKPGDTLVALSHHPEFFPIAAARNAMLILSSHTHGGRPLIVVYDYMYGIYRWNNAYLDIIVQPGAPAAAAHRRAARDFDYHTAMRLKRWQKIIDRP